MKLSQGPCRLIRAHAAKHPAFCTEDAPIQGALSSARALHAATHQVRTSLGPCAVHHRVGVRVFFADPRSPWNPNGLLRQYFPEGTDLSRWSEQPITAHTVRSATW